MAGLNTESCSYFWVLYVNCVLCFFGFLCIYHSRMSHFKFYLILMVFIFNFCRGLRTLNIASTEKADAEQTDKARAVVKKLRFPYTPYRFDNLKLQCHWHNIETLVLDYDECPEARDDTGNVFFCILYTLVRASWIKFNNCPTRCELFSLLYFCRQLYMFRVLTPIIRSSYNCNYSFYYWLTAMNKIRCC